MTELRNVLVTINKNEEHQELTLTDVLYQVRKHATLLNTNQPAPNLSYTKQPKKSTVINEHQTSVEMQPIKNKSVIVLNL